MRWRRRLLEFDFEPKYKKGLRNNVADMMSRLPTTAEADEAKEADLPCFQTGSLLFFVDHGKGIGEELINEAEVRDPLDLLDEQNSYTFSLIAAAIAPEDPVPERISLEEMTRAQSEDPFCTEIRARINNSE